MKPFRLSLCTILTLVFASLSGQVYAADFEDTTTGTNDEDVGTVKGLSASEVRGLDPRTQGIVNRFKDGRKSSAKDPGSRFSGILEMHDGDVNGKTDHNVSKGGNALEGGTERAALGDKAGTQKDEKRDGLWDKASQAQCERIHGKKYCDGHNNNISAVILDAGAAHGESRTKADGTKEAVPENEIDHRVYYVSKEATEAAEKAGKDYANRAMADASNYDAKGLSRVQNTAQKNKVRIQKADGTWEEVEANPNIDLLRSEASWLEDQRLMNVRNGWKTLRAKKLAEGAVVGGLSGVDDHQYGELVNSAYRSGKPEDGDKIVATKLADMRVAQDVPVCIVYDNGKNVGVVPFVEGADCKDAHSKGANGKSGVFAAKLGTVMNSAQDGAKDLKKDELKKTVNFNALPPDIRKNMIKERDRYEKEIARCMKQDTWCKADSDLDPKHDAKGDPGEAFHDTREYIYHQADKAVRGRLSDFAKTMGGNSDFNANTDKKIKDLPADKKPYAAMMKQWKENMDSAKANYDAEPDAAKKAKFDSSRASSMALTGRDPARDGTVLESAPPEKLLPDAQDQAPNSAAFAPPTANSPNPSSPY